MGNVLVVAETRGGKIGGASKEAVSVAAGVAERLGGRVEALVLDGPGESADAASLGAFGAAIVTVAAHEELAGYNPDAHMRAIVDRVRDRDYAAVMFSATTQGKDLAPRVAALLDVPLGSDVTSIEVDGETIVAERPVYAGKAVARLVIEATPVLVSLRPNAFSANESGGQAEVSSYAPELDPTEWKVRAVALEQSGGGALDVSEASVVVSGGRGMGDPSNWNLLEGLRDTLGSGAGLGASRAVVDAGWRPHGEQVGQTGKTVAPTLYIAIGISGAVQHLAGMRTAKTIVAINKDRGRSHLQGR